jgi:hypothetical protein
MEHEEQPVRREVEALKICKEQYKELFGEEMPTYCLMAPIHALASEKWLKFARSRLEHLTIAELDKLQQLLLEQGTPEPFDVRQDGVDIPTNVRPIKKNKDAKKKEG